MDDLETQVRGGLIEQEARDVSEYLSKTSSHPANSQLNSKYISTFTDIEKGRQSLINSLRLNDKIISRLTEIAKVEGLDKALKRETRNAVIREIFPTPEEYRSHVKKAEQMAEYITQRVLTGVAFRLDNPLRMLSGFVYIPIVKVFLWLGDKELRKSKRGYLDKVTAEIYQ